MKSLAIITARGGSKRIPKKNIRNFCGKPIIAYPISAALKSGIFSEVMVSTDNQEIADIAKALGAVVPFLRSQKNSDDFATTADVVREVIDVYRDNGKVFDQLCCLYPTSPFVTDSILMRANELMHKPGVNAVIPVVKFGFPIQRAFKVVKEQLVYREPEFKSTRSQDLEPLFHDSGQFYFIKTSAFENGYSLVPEGCHPLILNEMEVQDIDNEIDWKMAELKFGLTQIQS